MALTLDDCRRYLQSLGMGEELVERGMATVAAIERYLPARAEHIFVSERRDEEDVWRAGSLWLLGPGYMSEGFRFLTDAEFDVTRVDSGVARLVVDRGEQRLTVRLNFDSDILGLLEATGSNRRALEKILDGYLVPLLAARG